MVEPWDKGWTPSEGCRPVFRLADDSAGTSVVRYDDAFGIAAIQVEEGVQTPERIGIDSPLADVERAYLPPAGPTTTSSCAVERR